MAPYEIYKPSSPMPTQAKAKPADVNLVHRGPDTSGPYPRITFPLLTEHLKPLYMPGQDGDGEVKPRHTT